MVLVLVLAEEDEAEGAEEVEAPDAEGAAEVAATTLDGSVTPLFAHSVCAADRAFWTSVPLHPDWMHWATEFMNADELHKQPMSDVSQEPKLAEARHGRAQLGKSAWRGTRDADTVQADATTNSATSEKRIADGLILSYVGNDGGEAKKDSRKAKCL